MPMANISEIGEIVYEWDYDEEEYLEWLQENEIEDSEEAKLEYISDYVDFELDLLDNDTFHHMEYATMSLGDIEKGLGKRIADQILKDCMENGEGRLETQLMMDTVDLENAEEVNDVAMKLFNHGDYVRGSRGFILTNGVFIHTPSEHNMCTKIDGVKGTFHFIELGNIRVLDHSIDISKEPTREQYRTLSCVLASYEGETIYLDLGMGDKSVSIRNVNPSVLLNQISRYFREGIPPSSGMYEKKKFILRLTESELHEILTTLTIEMVGFLGQA